MNVALLAVLPRYHVHYWHFYYNCVFLTSALAFLGFYTFAALSTPTNDQVSLHAPGARPLAVVRGRAWRGARVCSLPFPSRRPARDMTDRVICIYTHTLNLCRRRGRGNFLLDTRCS
jgi:hypothetical protein